MYLNLGLISLLSTAFFLSPAAAVDIHFWPGFSCSGSTSWSIYGATRNNCYVATANGGAISFSDIPSGAKGQGYRTEGCTQYGAEAGPGISVCMSGGGYFRSANWFYPSKKLVRKGGPLEATRFSIRYELPDLTTREVEIPAGHFERAVKLLEEKNYEALAEFPVVC